MFELAIAGLVVGGLAFGLIHRFPYHQRGFLPIISACALITTGLIPRGLSLLDELLLAFGIGLLLWTPPDRDGPDASSPDRPLARAHQLAFTLLSLYLFAESIRGAAEFEGADFLDNLRKLRWSLLFLLLLVMGFLLPRRRNRAGDGKAIAIGTMYGGIWYVIGYLVTGIVAESVFGIGRYDLQPGHPSAFLWGTTAYALFPVVVAIPATIICATSPERHLRTGAIVSFVLWAVTTYYYNSRATLLAIIGFAGLWFWQWLGARARRFFVPGLLAGIVVAGVALRSLNSDSVFVGDLLKIWYTVATPSEVASQPNDLDRYVEIGAAFRAINASPGHWLFGYGYRMSGTVIAPFLAEVAGELSPIYYGRVMAKDWNNMPVEGLAALVLDSGMIGLVLILWIYYLLARRIWLGGSPMRLVLIGSLLLGFTWLFVIDIRDIALYFLILVPGGWLTTLAECGKAGAPAPDGSQASTR